MNKPISRTEQAGRHLEKLLTYGHGPLLSLCRFYNGMFRFEYNCDAGTKKVSGNSIMEVLEELVKWLEDEERKQNEENPSEEPGDGDDPGSPW